LGNDKASAGDFPTTTACDKDYSRSDNPAAIERCDLLVKFSQRRWLTKNVLEKAKEVT
jgi:hypothetical protein